MQFGELYYLPEMAWSEESRFRSHEMPARWAYRLTRLHQAKQNVDLFFDSTLAAAGPDEADVREDIKVFLTTIITHLQPFAEKWLSFPLVLYGLGDPNQAHASALATAVLRCHRGEEVDSSNTLTTYITDIKDC